MKQESKIIGIIGPSGVGKSTIIRELHKKTRIQIISTTTDRPQRPSEPEFEHTFVSRSQFDTLLAQHAFLEVVQPFSLPFRYGFPNITTQNLDTEQPTLVILRAGYVPLLKKHFPNCIIYQIEGPFDRSSDAVQNRGAGDTGTRITQFKDEIQAGRIVADRLFDNAHEDIKLIVNRVQEALIEDLATT